MKYVLDASVAIKWVIVEPDSNKATRLREDEQARRSEEVASRAGEVSGERPDAASGEMTADVRRALELWAKVPNLGGIVSCRSIRANPG